MRTLLAISSSTLALGIALALGLPPAACSRSGLFDVDVGGAGGTGGTGGSDAGGTGGTGGSDAGGTGGTGGVPGWPCPVELLGPVGIDGADNFHTRQPALTFSSDDRTRVTIAMEWVSLEGPAPLPSELRHTSLKPFASWPQGDLGPNFLASFDGGTSFAAAPSGGDRFALLVSDGGKPTPPAGIAFTTNMKPSKGESGPFTPVDSDGSLSHFLAQRGKQHLMGLGTTTGSDAARVRTVTEQGNFLAMGSLWELGCGAVVSADAVSVAGPESGDGWLVAVRAAAFATSDCSTLRSDVPDSISLAFVDTTLGLPSLRDNLVDAFVMRVALAPRGAGAWLAWTNSADVLKVALVEPSGSIGAPIEVASDAGLDETALAIAPAFGGLVVWHTVGGAARARLVLEDGTVSEPIAFPDFAAFDILGEPNGERALVSGVAPGSAGPDQVRLGLLRCKP